MEQQNNQKYISLKEASEMCEYSQEYLSLRARQRKLKAVKLGRNWFTTYKWLNEYIKKVGGKEVFIPEESLEKVSFRNITVSQFIKLSAEFILRGLGKISKIPDKLGIFIENHIGNKIEKVLNFTITWISSFDSIFKSYSEKLCKLILIILIILIGGIFIFNENTKAEFGKVVNSLGNNLAELCIKTPQYIKEIKTFAKKLPYNLSDTISDTSNKLSDLEIQVGEWILRNANSVKFPQNLKFSQNLSQISISKCLSELSLKNEKLKYKVNGTLKTIGEKIEELSSKLSSAEISVFAFLQDNNLSLSSFYNTLLRFHNTLNNKLNNFYSQIGTQAQKLPSTFCKTTSYASSQLQKLPYIFDSVLRNTALSVRDGFVNFSNNLRNQGDSLTEITSQKYTVKEGVKQIGSTFTYQTGSIKEKIGSVIKEKWEKITRKLNGLEFSNIETKVSMKRYDAISVIMEEIKNEFMICTMGFPSRELYYIKDRERNFYLTSSLGQAYMLALGLALAMKNTDEKIVCLEGDGSLMMNLGSLVVVADQKPKNYILIALDNGAYGSTRNFPTYTAKGLNLSVLAVACGFPKSNVFIAENREKLHDALDYCLNADGPFFIHVILKPGNEKVPVIPLKNIEIKERFMEAVKAVRSKNFRYFA